MYSSSPLDIGQQAPVTGIPVAPTNQQYPTQRYTPTAVKVPWSTGLYDCTADVPNCCLTCWCPCITFGHIADIVSQGSISCRASGAFFVLLSILTVCISNRIYSYTYRARLRSQYILEESPCRDCYLHFWCEACALCQEYRELKNRGFDVSLGWHGNWERQKILGVPMPMPMPMPMAPAEMETGMRR